MKKLILLVVIAAAVVLSAAGLNMLSHGIDTGKDRLYQVSTIDALLQGVYEGTVTIQDLEREGDTGIGTFNRLDGELVMIDGIVYQARADGSVIRAPNNETVPFASVTRFDFDRVGPLGSAANLTDVEQRLDAFLTSPNLFAMIRVDGCFDYVKVRSPPAQSEPYQRLVDAIAQQSVYEYRNATGTLVGTYSPPFATGVAVPGWHLHFISDDRSRGGHVLELASDGTAMVGIDDLTSFTVELPIGTDFTETDLSQNLSGDLDVVERNR